MDWDQKLKRLQENLGATAEGLAATLGITTRTLSDFMKPESQGGRPPTGPVQKLIDLLLGEMDAQDLARKPRLNLVLIHGDFRITGGQDPVDAILGMHTGGGRNNEFHYVTDAPRRDAKWAMEGLIKKRIQPHFFTFEPGMDSQEARDCFFTATAMWLATQAMRRDLAHITLAADAKKFWPLARELKELADVDVTLVREAGPDQDTAVETFLLSYGIRVADSAGRKIGVVTDLRADAMGNVSYGFITPTRSGPDGELIADERPLFFSYNHMLKDKRTEAPETEIGQLVVKDSVSFAVGMNYKGPCAIDVALVKRAEGAPELPRSTDVAGVKSGVTRRARPEDAELIEIIKGAVAVCADEEGWALAANVGSRISVLHPSFKERLQAAGYPNPKIVPVASTHPDIFEIVDGVGERYSATCMRLKPATR